MTNLNNKAKPKWILVVVVKCRHRAIVLLQSDKHFFCDVCLLCLMTKKTVMDVTFWIMDVTVCNQWCQKCKFPVPSFFPTKTLTWKVRVICSSYHCYRSNVILHKVSDFAHLFLCVCFQASLNCNFAEPPKPSYKNYR